MSNNTFASLDVHFRIKVLIIPHKLAFTLPRTFLDRKVGKRETHKHFTGNLTRTTIHDRKLVQFSHAVINVGNIWMFFG